LIQSIFVAAAENNLVLPRDFVLLAKTLMTVEGICKDLYPGLNILRELKPYSDSLIKAKATQNF
jgi:predicted unusual protein kinase regulating ubiquinone biosynthesis (AarF/ABC1/UbiB family)